MLGRFLNLNKMKTKDFQITSANILFAIEHREHNECLNGEYLHFYPLNELISNLMPATGLKKVGTGANKGSPICERVRKKIVEYFKNNVPQHQIAKALQISSSTVHITSSKDSENWRNLCVRDKAEDLCWIARGLSGPQTTLHHSSA